MHKFLRAVGFSNIKKQQLEKIFEVIIQNPTTKKTAIDSDGNQFTELKKEFGQSFGIALRGAYRKDNSFEMEYYYPYFLGNGLSTTENAEIKKHAEKESYAGVICDEMRIEIALIFYLQNVIEYLREKESGDSSEGIILSALSVEGKILFPMNKVKKRIKQTQQESKERNLLIAAAREGDEAAIESLTLEDMDTYALLSRRVTHEDIYSIVDSCFMPYGIESDQYSILGEITECILCLNQETKEEVYILGILCNDLTFRICINKNDLVGEPQIGRRFRGNIWMQGEIKYRK